MSNPGASRTSGAGRSPLEYNANSPHAPMTARRSSYASIVSGAAAAPSPAVNLPTQSGFLSHLINQNANTSTTPHSLPPHYSHHLSRSMDMSHSPGARHMYSDSWERGSLPHYSSFSGDGFGVSGVETRPQPEFFVPSYLKGSRHVERLEEKYRARVVAQRDNRSARASSNPGSLSTSASSMSLHKMVPSHRGMAYDVQEHPYARPEETVAELPSRWNSSEKLVGIEVVGDGSEAKFSGATKQSDQAAAVRAERPMPRECGVYYYEVTVLSKIKDSLIAIGFSGLKVPLTVLPGWESESWAYHGDDGHSFNQTSAGKPYSHAFGPSDVVGCGVNFRTGCAFFTRNGVFLGNAFRDLKRSSSMYPSVGMKKPGEHVKANFGQTPFVFDIEGYVRGERQRIMAEISAEDTRQLHDRGDEVSLTQELVAQYLAHDGYNETAKAFAKEVRAASRLLKGESADRPLEYQEDVDAIRRQRIRAAILDGDVDKAIKHTNAYYPTVLTDNENIYFKLRCRKFVEMIRRCHDLQSPAAHGANGDRRASPPAPLPADDDEYSDVFDGSMELDDAAPAPGPAPALAPRDDQMDTSADADADADTETDAMRAPFDTLTATPSREARHAAQLAQMNAALAYGQELKAEFREDPRREVKQALEDTFALIAYTDARESSLAALLEVDGRAPVAEELNGAILVSLGKSSSAALERLVQQTEVLVDDLRADGGAEGAALLNVRLDFMR